MTAISFGAARPVHARYWGWGASLLVHAAIIGWLLQALPRQAPQVDAATPEVHFVLVPVRPVVPVPPPAPPVPVPAPAVRAAPASAPVAAARARAAARAASTPAPAPAPIAMPEDHPAPAFTVAAPPAGGDGAGFDMAAARGAARADVAGEGIVLGRGQALRATRDEELGRKIEGARRGDCKTQYAGAGLLAIIPLVKDTVTGTGCKW